MDHEYLQNMMGSPYVNEGGFSRLKAKGAQAMGALGAMAGHQIQSPQETQLRSLWEGFMSSLKKIMKDWEGQVSPMFDQQVQLTEPQGQAKEALDALARTLSSLGPQKIGSAHDRIHNPDVRNQRDNPDTYVKGSAYNRSTTSPTKLKELAPDLEEGFWDAAKRDMRLNKALGSNDPSTILDSYKNHVLSLFQNFMKDAVKVTKMTAQQIYAMLAKMQPSNQAKFGGAYADVQGWQAAGNMQKVVQQLQALQNVGDIKGQGAPPVLNPQPGATPQGAPPVAQQPPQQPPQPQQQPQQPQQQPQGAPQPSSGGIPGSKGGNVPPEWLPFIVLKAMKIVIDAVKSDKEHVGTFFTGQELPTDYGGEELYGKVSPQKTGGTPSTTTETVVGPKPKDSSGGGGYDDADLKEPEEKEVPKQFLYNFHSKHRKTPASPFSIKVAPVTEDSVIKELPGSPKIDVWWLNEGHKNRVIAVVNGVKIPIMQFFDNEVSSKAGATTPGNANFFTAEKVLQASNPNVESPIAKASEEIKGQIKKLEPELLRALMATTGRKPMEFVPKIKLFPLSVDEEGTVTTNFGVFGKNEVEQQLKANNKMSKRWYATLDADGYFDKFPEMKPSGDSGQSNAADTDKETKIFDDAVKALVKLGYKEPMAKKELVQVWMDFAAIKDESKITTDELVHAVVSGKKPQAAPAPSTPTPTKPEAPSGATVSKPASGPEPTKDPSAATVSKPPGGPAPTKDPSAPVSDKGKEDAAQKAAQPALPPQKVGTDKDPTAQPPMQYSNVPGKDVPQQPEAEPSKGNFGPVKIKRNKLEWEHPKTHEIHLVAADDIENFAKKQPKFAKALTANPDLYSKYKAAIEKQKQAATQQPKPEGGSQVTEHLDYINPFNRENLFL